MILFTKDSPKAQGQGLHHLQMNLIIIDAQDSVRGCGGLGQKNEKLRYKGQLQQHKDTLPARVALVQMPPTMIDCNASFFAIELFTQTPSYCSDFSYCLQSRVDYVWVPMAEPPLQTQR